MKLNENNISKKLLDKYNFISENIKYSSFDISNYENKIIEPSNPNKMIEILNTLQISFSKIFEDMKNIISSDKHEFTNLLLELNKFSLEYYLYLKITLNEINLILNKINSEIKIEEITLEKLIKEIKKDFSKIYEIQFSKEELLTKTKLNIIKLIENFKEIKNSNNKPGIILIHTSNYIIETLKEIQEKINQFNLISKFQDSSFFGNQTQKNQIILFDLLIYLNKIPKINILLYKSFLLKEDDISNLKEENEKWKKIQKKIYSITPKKNLNIEKLIFEIEENLESKMIKMEKLQNEGLTSFLGSSLKKMFNSFQSEYEIKKFKLKNFDEESILKKRESSKNSMMKSMIKRNLPYLEFRKKLYLKKELKEISIDYINKLNNFLKGEKENKEEFKLEEKILKKPLLIIDKCEKEEKQYYVKTRLYHSSEINFKKEKESKNKINKSLIIYIHGGDFINENIILIEKYIRKWVIKLNIPLLLIKYPLIPENCFPKALNEIYQSYIWIINHAKEELNMDINNIIICGDSNGGLLSFSLCYLIISINLFEGKNIKIPDLIFTFYPYSNLEKKNMGFSHLLSLNNDKLNFDLIDYIRNKYLNNYNGENNMFVNPVFVNEKIIEKLNKIRILFGSKDPFKDDSINLINQFSQFDNCDIKGFELTNFNNGFISIQNNDLEEIIYDIFYEEIEKVVYN